MQWFKHSTGSHRDPDFVECRHRIGDRGTSIFWEILELYGMEYNHRNDDDEVFFSWHYLCHTLGRTRQSLGVSLAYWSSTERFVIREGHESTGVGIWVRIPKFIGLASNWTKRTTESPTEVSTEMPTEVSESLPTEAPTAIEEEVEEKKKKKKREKRNHALALSQEFDQFWEEYPRKLNKADAIKAWNSAILPAIDELLSALRLQKKSDQWMKDDGNFIPYPASWIRAERWKDEFQTVGKNPVEKISPYVICLSCKREVLKQDFDLDSGKCIHCLERKPLTEILVGIGHRMS